MSLDNRLHVLCAAVRHFDLFSVQHFVEGVVDGEMFVKEF